MSRDEISRSSKKTKHCYSDQPRRISTLIQLPEELLYEIFLRLPVKSLIRFRCLSNGTRRMIDSRIFVKTHNDYRSECESSQLPADDYAILLISQLRYRPLLSMNFHKDNPNRAKAVELNCTLRDEYNMLSIGCCNGIFCFMNTQPEIYLLWNPSNGTSRIVQCSNLLQLDDTVCSVASIGYDHSYVVASIGYDHVTDDYKIIRFVGIYDTRMDAYSFRKDSWKKFNGKFPSSTFRPGRGVCISGAMHWLIGIPTNYSSMFIAAFDFATETFKSLPLPVEARERELKPYEILDFGGCLCVSFFRPDNLGAHTVWVMKKYGVETSWTKLYDIDSLPIFYYPNRESRLLCNCGCLTWWDPQDNSFERIEFTGSKDEQPMYSAWYIYVRNLIRLDRSCI